MTDGDDLETICHILCPGTMETLKSFTNMPGTSMSNILPDGFLIKALRKDLISFEVFSPKHTHRTSSWKVLMNRLAVQRVDAEAIKVLRWAAQDEIGYWLGVPFGGQRLVPDAIRKLTRYYFEDMGCTAVWVGYYEGNEGSGRVMQKAVLSITIQNRMCFADFLTNVGSSILLLGAVSNRNVIAELLRFTPETP